MACNGDQTKADTSKLEAARPYDTAWRYWRHRDRAAFGDLLKLLNELGEQILKCRTAGMFSTAVILLLCGSACIPPKSFQHLIGETSALADGSVVQLLTIMTALILRGGRQMQSMRLSQ